MTTFKNFQTASATAALFGAVLLCGGKAAADQVIPDDLIVQGSTCIGLDCVNNENFGFDTLRLKENNLRIHFLDTSTSTGFPANDWRIVVNDSASGGSNFFAIEDATAGRQIFKVEAGAPANALFVDSTGNIGISTSTPVLDLHMATANTPAMRLEQNNSGGFTAQTWDIAGNEANFFVRDVTGGSRLPLRIRPGAPTSSIDVAATGNVGLGTASPQAALHVNRTGTAAAIRLQGAAGKYDFHVDNGSNLFRIFDNGNVARFAIDPTGNVGIGTITPGAQFNTTGTVRFGGVNNCSSGIVSNASGDLACLSSSRQFKNVAGDLAPAVALANIMALRPQTGAYKATPDAREHWFIAEEVAAVDPALVGTRDGQPYTVKTHGIVADLVAVIQQQQRRIEALEQAIKR